MASGRVPNTQRTRIYRLTTISRTAEEAPGPNSAEASIFSQLSRNHWMVFFNPSSKGIFGS